MARTYQDFAWVVEHYPWSETSLYVTYVRDAEPSTVLDAMTHTDQGTVVGLEQVNEKGWSFFSTVGAARLGRWTVAFAPSNGVGTSDDTMVPLSLGREVLTHSEDAFFIWVDGVRVTYFDPLLKCGFGLDPMPEEWRPRMREVGIDPDGSGPSPDGKFHPLEAGFAMVANHTGVEITPEFLSSTEFLIGTGDG